MFMLKNMRLFFAIILMSGCISVSAQTDTMLYSVIDSLVVTGYDSEQNLLRVPGSIHLLTAEKLESFDDEHILTSLNVLPGVQMEQRSPGSYRMAIRGSTLRSPFGVRNIKVYWNDIPFTDPSGSTDLNLLDNLSIQRIEVLKGPAGSVYGAGTGGVLNMSSLPEINRRENWKLGIEGGSYGYYKVGVQKYFTGENHLTAVRLSRQASDGYRDHTSYERISGELSSRISLSRAHSLSTHLLYTDMDYQIPGGLTEAEWKDNPRQARQPSPVVLGSKEADAGVRQNLWLGGVTHEYTGNRISAKTTFYGSFSSPRDNPFNLDYKRDLRSAAGGRARLDYFREWGAGVLKATAGAEYQHGYNDSRNFENDYGKPGRLNFDDELATDQFLLFGRLEYSFGDSSFLSLGLSRNSLEYGINRLVDNILDTSYQVIRSFKPVYIPRAAYSKMWNRIGVHASVSMGYSPPTIEDVRTNEGTINEDLEPELGINYEIGARGFLWGRKLSFDWSAYYFNLNETIVQQQSPRGTVIFENSGSTDQFGMETLLEGDFRLGGLKRHSLHAQASHTLHLYYFDDYNKFDGGEYEDLSGNRLTGVPRNIFAGSLQWQAASGWYANVVLQAVGEIPLNDENTVFSSSYQDVAAKAGYVFRISERLETEVFAGVRNALNEKYSLGYDLNAVGGRYYQPAPARNFYIGMKFGF